MKLCPFCLKEIPPRKRKVTGPSRVYCSKVCTWKARNAKRSPGRDKRCFGCGKQYKDSSSSNNTKICDSCFDRRTEVYRYKISGEEARKLRKSRNTCEICNRPGILCIDHCHKTNKLRGILCRKCNAALGGFEDNPNLLQNAITYLFKLK
jgi:Recombination endonuclease VII